MLMNDINKNYLNKIRNSMRVIDWFQFIKKLTIWINEDSEDMHAHMWACDAAVCVGKNKICVRGGWLNW